MENKSVCTTLLKMKYNGYIGVFKGFFSLETDFKHKSKCQQDINKYFENNNYPILLYSIKSIRTYQGRYDVWFRLVFNTTNKLENPQFAFNSAILKEAVSEIISIDFISLYNRKNSNKLTQAFTKKYGKAKK